MIHVVYPEETSQTIRVPGSKKSGSDTDEVAEYRHGDGEDAGRRDSR